MQQTRCVYIAAHGQQSRVTDLNFENRSQTSVIAIGTEGSFSYLQPYHALLLYFIHVHGQDFLLELENLFLFYGDRFYRQEASVFRDDFRVLFDQYKKDIRRRPRNKMRYYSTRDTIQDLELTSNFPNEANAFIIPYDPTVLSSQIGHKIQKGYSREFPDWRVNLFLDRNHQLKNYGFISTDTTFRIACLPRFRLSFTENRSVPETCFQQRWQTNYLASLRHRYHYQYRESLLTNVPLGAYDIRPSGCFRKEFAITTRPVFLQQVLEECFKDTPSRSRRLVLLVCCRGYGEGVPTLKYQTREQRGVQVMMRALTLTDQQRPERRTKKRRERDDQASQRSPKRKT